jgi:hypothetical protein
MKLIKTAGACAVAAAIGCALVCASLANASDREGFGPLAASPFSASLLTKELLVLTNQGIPPPRAWQAIDVQGKVAQEDLIGKVETGTGSAFAGAWFAPAAAQLHIGATSPESRRTAEAAVAQAGLSADVTVTPVRSTLAELLATQQRWNRKLADLFAREQVTTGLEPQNNAVSVALSSSVPASERAALIREASASAVNVSVTSVATEQLSITPQAKTECNNWARLKAYCNPSITSGVTIATNKKPECTAGPLAINEKKQRVVLTAGHCIKKVGENWSAFNTKEVESVLGPVESFSDGAEEGGKKIGDYGDIVIEAAWQNGKPEKPVFAVTAEWKQMENTSYPVKGEREPLAGNTDCHEGQTSGESCGEIKRLNVTLVTSKKYYEGLVEDAGANLIGEGGDSGGPWLFIETNKEARMEGTLTGFVPQCEKLTKVEKGNPFFKTQAECSSLVFKEAPTNEGEWKRTAYKCKNTGKVQKGAKFFKTEEECKEQEKAGEGEIELTPELHLVWMPLKQPIKGAAPGSLTALKLELLTTGNE